MHAAYIMHADNSVLAIVSKPADRATKIIGQSVHEKLPGRREKEEV